MWRINLFSNVNLLVVVAISFAIQIWSHHSGWLAHVLKTSFLHFHDCLLLLVIAAVPLAALELHKVFFTARRGIPQR